MLLNGKPIDQVTEAELLSLIETQRREDQFIDYKNHVYKTTRALDAPRQATADNQFRRDLCGDICAFANAYGGWIICGIDEGEGEQKGIAKELRPLPDFVADTDIDRLRQIIEAGIEPRVSGIQMESVPVSGGQVLVIYIPRSFAGPHRVKESRYFQTRRLNGNGELDMQEIRRAFIGNATYAEQIRDFRRQRVEAILGVSETKPFVELQKGAKIVIHLMPLGMSENPQRLSLTSTDWAKKAFNGTRLVHLGYSSIKHNIDGVLYINRPDLSKPAISYVQVFRSGVIEYVESNNPIKFNLHMWQHRVLMALCVAIRLQRVQGIDEPCFVGVTLTDLKLLDSPRAWHQNEDDGYGLDTVSLQDFPEKLYLPEQYVEYWNNDVTKPMRPLLDIWANALGWGKALGYDETSGEWTLPNRDAGDLPSIVVEG